MSAYAPKRTLGSVLFEAILRRSCNVRFGALTDISVWSPFVSHRGYLKNL